MATLIGYIDRQLTQTLPNLALTPLSFAVSKATPSFGKAPDPVVKGFLATTKRLGDVGVKRFPSLYPVTSFALAMRQLHVNLLQRTAQAAFVEAMASNVKSLAESTITDADTTTLDTIPGKVREVLNDGKSPDSVTHAELFGAVARKGVNSLAAWTLRTVVFVGIPYYAPSSTTFSFAFTAASVALLHYSLANRARYDLEALNESKSESRTLTGKQKKAIVGEVSSLADSVPRKFKRGLAALSFKVEQASFATLPKLAPKQETKKAPSAATTSSAAQADPGTGEFWRAEFTTAKALVDKFSEGSEEQLAMKVRMLLAARNFYHSKGNTAKGDEKDALWRTAVATLAEQAKQAVKASDTLPSSGDDNDDDGAGVARAPAAPPKGSKKASRHRKRSGGAAAKAGKKERKPPTPPPSSNGSSDDDAILLDESGSDGSSSSD
ncbi:MAG: hypothetical protein P0S96_05460 [Simkaniaceae bacterium]|nr:hypothetical protein [Candidatus Sacchlamyda saccharinae]